MSDPLIPTQNADGKDVYALKTIGDLSLLYAHLSPEKRALLLKDLANGLEKGAPFIMDAIDGSKLPVFLRGLWKRVAVKMVRTMGTKWIDDDKGRVTVKTYVFSTDSDPIHTQEL